MSWLLKIVLLWALGYMYLFKLLFSLDIYPTVGLLDHMVALFLVFKGTVLLFSIVAVSIYFSTNSVWKFPLFPHPLQYLFFVAYVHLYCHLRMFLQCLSHINVNKPWYLQRKFWVKQALSMKKCFIFNAAWLVNCLTIQQSHCWAYTLRKPEGKETRVPQCSSQHCL